MLFEYKAIDENNSPREGTVEATTEEAAIGTVQQRGYTVISIKGVASGDDSILEKSGLKSIGLLNRVKNKEVVILSRQIATLFEAQVSALQVFLLLAAEAENPELKRILGEIAEDLQGGSTINRAISKHPKVFTPFYISMVKAGEDSGSLDETFAYLADYLDRVYQVTSKVKNALIYPAFVITIFFIVMGLMLTLVIPKISQILLAGGQELPIYTKVVIGLSDFMANNVIIILVVIFIAGVVYWRFSNTDVGKRSLDELSLSFPYISTLNSRMYLTHICDNLSTMLSSGISMVQALEVTADVVDNLVYKEIIQATLLEVKEGRSFSESVSEYSEIPSVFSQMSRVGEESGNLPDILKTLAEFYRKEVNNAVDTLIGLIEPAMIVFLGLGVGILLASVLAPIYNITNTI